MGRDPCACPGGCNAQYRRAWDEYDVAVPIYRKALKAYRAEMAAREADAAAFTRTQPSEGDRTHEAVAARSEPPQPPEPPDLEPWLGDPVWCPRCVATIRRALAAVDDLAALLDSWADGHRGQTSGEPVSGSRGSPSPSPITDTLDRLYGDLADIEAEWRQVRRYAGRPRRPRGGQARALCVAWLLGHLGEILADRDYIQFGMDVLAWERTLQRLTKSEPVVRRRPGRCPRCRLRALRTRDDGYTECCECGRLMDEDEYQARVEREAQAS